MKTRCLSIVLLLFASGCMRPSEYSAGFTVTTVIPVGVSDARREVWKIQRMLLSARFHDIATAGDAQLITARLHVSTDRTMQRLEVSTLATSEDLAFRAAQAYAKAASVVLKDRRAEFEVLPAAGIDVGPVSISATCP